MAESAAWRFWCAYWALDAAAGALRTASRALVDAPERRSHVMRLLAEVQSLRRSLEGDHAQELDIPRLRAQANIPYE